MAVTVRGVTETIQAFDRFENDTVRLKSANEDLGRNIASRATAIAPKLSGRLAASIGYKEVEGGVQIYAGNDAVPYAGVIEYGWPQKGREERPYLRPATYQYVGQVKDTYENAVQQIIVKYNLQ